MATQMLLLHVATLKLRPGLCVAFSVLRFSPTLYSVFLKLFYTPYVHFGWAAKDCLESCKWKIVMGKKGENRLFYSLYRLSVLQAKC